MKRPKKPKRKMDSPKQPQREPNSGAAAFRAALGLPAAPVEEDDSSEDEEKYLDDKAALKYDVCWARDIGRSSSDSDDAIVDSDHDNEESSLCQKRAKKKRKKDVCTMADSGNDAGAASGGWTVGDKVEIDGRLAVVIRDMRPKHNRATVLWHDTGREEKKIDAGKIRAEQQPKKKKQ